MIHAVPNLSFSTNKSCSSFLAFSSLPFWKNVASEAYLCAFITKYAFVVRATAGLLLLCDSLRVCVTQAGVWEYSCLSSLYVWGAWHCFAADLSVGIDFHDLCDFPPPNHE